MDIAITRIKAAFLKAPLGRYLVVFPVPLGAHEHRLLGTGDNFFIRFDGSAQEYDDAASLGYVKARAKRCKGTKPAAS